MEERPKVGAGVLVKNEDKVLFLKRKNSHGENTWSFPGGHLEFNEELEDCVRREVEEETGIKVKNIKFETITNDIFKEEGKHYITIFMSCEYDSGKVQVMEEDKCTQVDWFDWNELPRPLFLPIENLLKNGFDPFK